MVAAFNFPLILGVIFFKLPPWLSVQVQADLELSCVWGLHLQFNLTQGQGFSLFPQSSVMESSGHGHWCLCSVLMCSFPCTQWGRPQRCL